MPIALIAAAVAAIFLARRGAMVAGDSRFMADMQSAYDKPLFTKLAKRRLTAAQIHKHRGKLIGAGLTRAELARLKALGR